MALAAQSLHKVTTVKLNSDAWLTTVTAQALSSSPSLLGDGTCSPVPAQSDDSEAYSDAWLTTDTV
jgi:hypothetical protein